MNCTCNVDESRIKIDYVNYKIDAPWSELCDYCANGLGEVFVQVAEREAEDAHGLVASGISADEAKRMASWTRDNEPENLFNYRSHGPLLEHEFNISCFNVRKKQTPTENVSAFENFSTKLNPK